MVTSDERRALRVRVESVFAAVERPPREAITPHRCDECDAVRGDLAPVADWRAIDPALLEEHRGDLPLLGAPAVAFFLPAFLVAALDRWDSDDLLSELLLYYLGPGVDPENVRDGDAAWWVGYYQERLSALSGAQVAAIDAFVSLILRDARFETEFPDLASGWQRVRGYLADGSAAAEA